MELFEGLGDVSNYLKAQGTSLESLKEEYCIGRETNIDPFKENEFLLCSDDSGTPCLTGEEYRKVVKSICSLRLSSNDKKFIIDYVGSRIRAYVSPRRGGCIALRGHSYYRMIDESNNDILFRHLRGDLNLDLRVYKFISRSKFIFPKEVCSMVIEHIKNSVFRIMYAYIIKSLNKPNFFRAKEWSFLDVASRTLWDIFVHILLDPRYKMKTQIEFNNQMNYILDRVSDQDFRKIRELDSAKTLLRMAHAFYQKDDIFDFCLPLYYGGIEMAYAFYAYGLINKKKAFDHIIPIVFSLNRIRKGHIDKNILDSSGLIKWDNFSAITPEYFIKKMELRPNAKMIVLDNNITSGYSIKVASNSLKAKSFKCDICVAEINIQEIKAICENLDERKKAVVVRGKDLYCPPTGEYVTCFGVKDSSRVVNRIKLILGSGGYTQIEGYDFDGSIFNTNPIHRKSWNKALNHLKINFDVKMLPSNSGLTLVQAAKNIFRHLSEKDFKINMGEKDFVSQICDLKIMFMVKFPLYELIPIARTVNLIKSDVANTKIIISNNNLDFILRCLKKARLLRYFSHIICDDFAYSVKTKERVVVVGELKPKIDGYKEVSTYFGLPRIQTYYGDDPIIDREFSDRVGCNFVLIDRSK